MKYLLNVFLIFCLACEDQKSIFVKAENIPSNVDSLKSAEDVQNFVQNRKHPSIRLREHNDSIIIHRPLSNFELKKIRDFDRIYRNDRDSITKLIADSLKIDKSFYKADIDNNGYTDLVIIGDDKGCSGSSLNSKKSISCDYSVYALMNFGNDSINPVDLILRDNFGGGIIPKVGNINSEISLEIIEPQRYSSPNNKVSELKKTRVVYKYGAFVDYNDSFKEYSIEKIEYSTSACYGSCPIFELVINSDRKANLNAIEFNSLDADLWEYEISNELKGKFKTTIDEKNHNKIVGLLNYLDFPNLEDNYFINETDNPGCKLTITYNQSKTKTIHDYGKTGTLGLKKLYRLISNLRTNQNWN